MTSYVQPLRSAGWGHRVGARLRARLDAARTAARARAAAQHSRPLVGAEHSLVVVCADGGRWIAGTDRALYHSRRELSRAPTTAEWVRLGWEEIAGLAWDADAGVVTVTGLLPTVPPRMVLPLPVPPAVGETLAGLARERISSTEVVRTRLDLGQHGAVRVVGRRAPGTDELVWLAVVPTAARDDAGAAAALSDALRRLRVDLGV
jgi:hypothetical protein